MQNLFEQGKIFEANNGTSIIFPLVCSDCDDLLIRDEFQPYTSHVFLKIFSTEIHGAKRHAELKLAHFFRVAYLHRVVLLRKRQYHLFHMANEVMKKGQLNAEALLYLRATAGLRLFIHLPNGEEFLKKQVYKYKWVKEFALLSYEGLAEFLAQPSFDNTNNLFNMDMITFLNKIIKTWYNFTPGISRIQDYEFMITSERQRVNLINCNLAKGARQLGKLTNTSYSIIKNWGPHQLLNFLISLRFIVYNVKAFSSKADEQINIANECSKRTLEIISEFLESKEFVIDIILKILFLVFECYYSLGQLLLHRVTRIGHETLILQLSRLFYATGKLFLEIEEKVDGYSKKAVHIMMMRLLPFVQQLMHLVPKDIELGDLQVSNEMLSEFFLHYMPTKIESI